MQEIDRNASDLVILGRKIGTYETWDQHDTFVFTFYNVKAINYEQAYDWNIDFDKGHLEIGDKPIIDLIDAISIYPREVE